MCRVTLHTALSVVCTFAMWHIATADDTQQQLIEITRQEQDILSRLAENARQKEIHNANPAPPNDAAARERYNSAARAGFQEYQRLHKELAEVRRQKEALLAAAQLPAAAKITSAAVELVKSGKFQVEASPGGQTKCNLFVAALVEKTRGADAARLLNGKKANGQFDALSAAPDWKPLGFQKAADQTSLEDVLKRAQTEANQGKVVVVAYRHLAYQPQHPHSPTPKELASPSGHVAVLVPATVAEWEPSGAWQGMKMPFVAQAGTANPGGYPAKGESVFQRLRLSWAFPYGARQHIEVFVLD